MYQADDTIVAIATPMGRGGLGVVRLSGPDAARIAVALTTDHSRFEPRHATFSRIAASTDAHDQAVITYFQAPHSYTGEDVVEISAHGSPVLLRGIVQAAMAQGARLAEPGEFTFRAFLRGRMDLVQAEAVRDLVDAVTPLQARAAYDQLEGTLTSRIREIDQRLFDLRVRLEASLDFPEEGYHFIESGDATREIDGIIASLGELLASSAQGRLIREGLRVVIAGRPNAGKSSLFNALAGVGRAIVTDTPGTTRDLLTELIDINGVPMTFVDTAGIRAGATDPVEIEGIARAQAARGVAQVTLVVLDRSRPLDADDEALMHPLDGPNPVIVANKCDLAPAWTIDELDLDDGMGIRQVSAQTGEGLEGLREDLVEAISEEPIRDVPAITNVRHQDLLVKAREALRRAAAAAANQTPEEFVLADLDEARVLLEEVTGARTSDDVLTAIFERFCIGK